MNLYLAVFIDGIYVRLHYINTERKNVEMTLKGHVRESPTMVTVELPISGNHVSLYLIQLGQCCG